MNTLKKTKKQKKTFKVQTRLDNSKSRKNDIDIIDKHVTVYKELDSDSIIKESNSIIDVLSDSNIRNKSELLSKYEALKIIMEQRITDTYKFNYDYIYPDYYDPEFNSKIFSKKEFKLNKISKKDVMTLEEEEAYSQKVCNPSKDKTFNLTPNQKFLKSFMSPNTPYNSILLYHGTGVGKTCTSISIAEQYSLELKESKKK